MQSNSTENSQSPLVQFNQNYGTPFADILNKLDTPPLLKLLACNKIFYTQVQRYLFKQNTRSALQYQEAWIKRAVLNPAQALQFSTVDKPMIKHWLARRDLTNEARFFGLLFRNSLHNIPLVNLGITEKLTKAICGDLTNSLINSLDDNKLEQYLKKIGQIFIYLLPTLEGKNKIFSILLERKLTKASATLFNCLVLSNLSQQQIDQLHAKLGDITKENIQLIYKTLIMILPRLSSENIQTMGSQMLAHVILPNDCDHGDCQAAFKLVVASLPHLDLASRQSLFNSIIQKMWGDNSTIQKNWLEILLPSLRSEYIESLLPLLLDKINTPDRRAYLIALESIGAILPQLQPNQTHAVHKSMEGKIALLKKEGEHNRALELVTIINEYAPRLELGETETILSSLFDIFIQAMQKNDIRGWDACEILIPRLNSSQISLIFTLTSTKLSQLTPEENLKIVEKVLKLSTILKPYLKISEMKRMLPFILKLLSSERFAIQKLACETLIGFLTHLEREETLQVYYFVLDAMKNMEDYWGTEIKDHFDWDFEKGKLNALFPCLEETQIKEILTQIEKMLADDGILGNVMGCDALIALLPRLAPDQIHLAFKSLIAILRKIVAGLFEDETPDDLLHVVVQTLAALLPKMTSGYKMELSQPSRYCWRTQSLYSRMIIVLFTLC